MRIGIQALALQGANDFRKAGVARYAYCVIDEMLRMGKDHEFRIFLTPEFDPPAHWSSLPNVRIHRRWNKQRLWSFVVGGIMARIWRLDVWFSVANSIPPVGLVKRAIFIHDLFPLRRPEFFNESELDFYRSNFGHACRNADLILTNSESTRADVIELSASNPGSNAASVIVTYLGPGNLAPIRDPESVSAEELGLPYDKFIFTLGTLEPRKNLVALIEAFAKLPEKHRDVGLVIGGGRGWKEDAIFDRVKELGLTDRVTFLGYVEDEVLPALFAKCEAFAYPSLDEGFGIPVLEALLYGAPVVSSNAGALPEVGGDAARYFDPSDTDGIARALSAVLDDPLSRADWVAKGRAQASKFSWQRCATETLAALSGLGKR